jgi:hypothetical protein
MDARYRRLIVKILPFGTKRRYVYSLFAKGIRFLFSHGAIELLKKMGEVNWQKEFKQSLPSSQISTEKTQNDEQQINSSINRNPIFVYQMGRVGSISIFESLRNAYTDLAIEIPIYHFHYLANFGKLAERAKKDFVDPTKFLESLESHKTNRETVLNLPAQIFNIVSLVRDPIARNVSTFFHALDEFIPDWEQRRNEGNLDVNELHRVFLSKDSYIWTALNWFDEQVTPVFGLNVFATPFSTDLGYKIYSSPKANLLVIRLENLNDCVNQALHEFLGIDNFRLLRINTGEDRKTGGLYRLFMTKPLPEGYIDRMYDTKLAKHFYTVVELDAFKRNWMAPEQNIRR